MEPAALGEIVAELMDRIDEMQEQGVFPHDASIGNVVLFVEVRSDTERPGYLTQHRASSKDDAVRLVANGLAVLNDSFPSA